MLNKTDPYTNYYFNSLNRSPSNGTSLGFFDNSLDEILLPPVSYANSYLSNNRFKKTNPINPIKPIGAKLQSLGLQKLETDKLLPKKEKKNWLKGLFSKDNLKTAGKDLGNTALEFAPEIVDIGLNTVNAKQADNISVGEQGFSSLTTGLFKGALKTGNPFAIAGAAVLKGVDYLNRFGGDTAQEQATKGINLTGYNTATSLNAGLKNTLLGKLSGKTKNTNRETKRADQFNVKAGVVSYVGNQNLLASTNSMQDVTNKNANQLFGGQNYRTLAAKKGTKLSFTKIKKQAARKIQEGGKMNLLPTGALHARKHNLSDEIAEDLTKKGIPVISYDEGGEVVQHAEIEKDELIFNINLTKQLEKLKEEFDNGDENAALIAGQLLTKEILLNTIDKSKLIQNII